MTYLYETAWTWAAGSLALRWRTMWIGTCLTFARPLHPKMCLFSVGATRVHSKTSVRAIYSSPINEVSVTWLNILPSRFFRVPRRAFLPTPPLLLSNIARSASAQMSWGPRGNRTATAASTPFQRSASGCFNRTRCVSRRLCPHGRRPPYSSIFYRCTWKSSLSSTKHFGTTISNLLVGPKAIGKTTRCSFRWASFSRAGPIFCWLY